MDIWASIYLPAVFVAALTGFAIGGLWYGPLFQKPWMRHSGMTFEKGKQQNRVLVFGMTYGLNLVAAASLSMFLGPARTWQFGVAAGIAAGVTFIGTALGIVYLFESRPLQLFLINAGYQTVNFAAMGAIVGAWH